MSLLKLVDNNLELLEWKPGQSGPNIGDAVPTSYGYRKWADKLEFYIINEVKTSKTPSWLGAIARSLPPAGYNHLALNFDLVLDGNSVSMARCLEFDIRVCLAKLGYNCSSQINNATGIWQISDVNGNWVDTGYHVAALKPWTLQHFRIEYAFDFVGHKYSIVGIKINDAATFMVPDVLRNLAATPLAWDDSCSIQVQQDMYGNVGTFSQIMWNIDLEWTA